mgnify:CR=1 FL=1
MKKLVVIAVVGAGLFLVSCEKESFGPRACEKDAPSWEVDDSFGKRGAKTESDMIVIDGGTITDPNDDEDGNGKKKGKTN